MADPPVWWDAKMKLPDDAPACTCGRAGQETSWEQNPEGHTCMCARWGIPASVPTERTDK